jgi:hypothetical protein
VADLRTGTVRAIWHPLSVDFQTLLNGFGAGTFTLDTKEVSVRDIWPHLTSVYAVRISGADAPAVEFAGMVQQFSADDGGATRVGVVSIDDYLNHRILTRRMDFSGGTDQNAVAASLVKEAETDGIPLTAIFQDSAFQYEGVYELWDYKNIGEAISELSDSINGPDWELVHTKVDGRWSTQIIFRDFVGVTRDIILRSDQAGSGYGLDVNGSEHATYVVGLGEGEENSMLTSLAEDESGFYPRFDAAPSWKDVSRQITLDRHTEGYLEDHQEPVALPSMEVAGMEPAPTLTELGDSVNLDIRYGAVTYQGPARIVSRGWKLDPGSPTIRSFDMVPLTRASESVLPQQPVDDCEDC